ncbi:inverse autotransporter beta domain-containing protein, partial [Ewingella americana]|uniref:inverse autotransporter beta domain-containing protein n=1 Tax=Ewingella americana TaxID=41202 RepID=UPI00139B38D9
MNLRHSKRLRLVVYVQAALQIMLPLQVSWANSPVALPKPTAINVENTNIETARREADLINLNYFKRVHEIKKNETLSNIAKNSHISLLTLREINRIHIPDDKAFYALKAGEYVMVPDWLEHVSKNTATALPADLGNSQTNNRSVEDIQNDSAPQVSSTLSSLGGALQARDQSSAARSLAVGTATGAATRSVQDWMNQFGNSRASINVDDHLRYNGVNADVLLPIGDKEAKNLTFSQVGITDKDHYTTLNLGIGQRFFEKTDMLGYNLFLDQELRNQHTRIGIGGEYWRDFLKLAGNFYTGLTSWKESKQLEDYQERPATGFDLRAEAWLPAFPQLGGKLKFEQYFGDQVALVSINERHQDPSAITAGLNYTPVSLVTAGIDQRYSNGVNDTQFNLQFNYQLGVPLSQQLDSEYVKQRRTLTGSRLDFVDRNNEMVMDFRKMEVITLSLPEKLIGEASSVHTITATVRAKHGLKDINWNTSSVPSASKNAFGADETTLTLTLPDKPGIYPLSALAHDKRGNSSNTASMLVEVLPNTTQPGHQIADIKAAPLTQTANGIDVITYTLKALAPDGSAAKNTRVRWQSNHGTIQQDETRTNDNGEAITTVVSQDAGRVSMKAVLLDEAGSVLIDKQHDDAEFIIVKEILSLTTDKTSAKANGSDIITFTYLAKDEHGKALSGRTLAWTNANALGEMTDAQTTTDSNGQATAKLTSLDAGKAKLAVSLKNPDGTEHENTLSPEVDFTLSVTADIQEDRTNAQADGSDAIIVTYTAKDVQDKPVANAAITWDTTVGTLGGQPATTD